MHSDITTRAATDADADAIYAVCRSTWPGAADHLLEELEEAVQPFCVAELNGHVCAFLHASSWTNWRAIAGMEEHDPEAADARLLNWIAVAPQRRGTGIGSTLLTAWLQALPSTVHYVVLNPWPADDGGTEADKRLRQFYLRNGFRLLPSSDGVERSYLLGWEAPGAPGLPASPPWPAPPPDVEPPSAQERAAVAHHVAEYKRRLGVGTDD